jgi:DinB superfamily
MRRNFSYLPQFTMQPITTFFPTLPTSTEAALEQMHVVRTVLLHDLQTQQFSAPTEGRWSVDEILWHLHLVERGVGSGLRRALEGPRNERATDEQLTATWLKMKKLILNRVEVKITAPDNLVPQGNMASREECIIALGQSQSKVLSHVQGVSMDDLRSVAFPHSFLGVLPGFLWITFIAMHEARHLEQMRELITA